MPKKRKGESSQDQEALGERQKMSGDQSENMETDSSTSTSSLMGLDSESQLPSGNGSESTHSSRADHPVSSSSFPSMGSSSTSVTSPGLRLVANEDDAVEKERLFSLNIGVVTYGKADHVRKAAIRILKQISLTNEVAHCYLDSEEMNCDHDYLKNLKT